VLRAEAAKARDLDELRDWLRVRNAKYSVDAVEQPAEQLPLSFLPRLASMKPGEIAVFATPLGASVIQLVHAEEAPLTEQQAAPLIEQFLAGRRRLETAAAEVKRLFRPFAQASKAVAHRYGGAGLGLIFVKRIAEAMGGTLKIQSAPGRGSRFRLEVVAAPKPVSVAEGDADAQRTHVAAAPAKSLRILCAEDNPYGRVVLNTILTELGHRADFVDTGGAAVEAVGRGEYDALLMDITLPDLDGMAATRLIRGLTSSGARLPIIGISGRSEATEQAAARAAGMNAYLTKPVSPAAIAAMLDSLAGH